MSNLKDLPTQKVPLQSLLEIIAQPKKSDSYEARFRALEAGIHNLIEQYTSKPSGQFVPPAVDQNNAFEAFLANKLPAERQQLIADDWADLKDKSNWDNFESYLAVNENKKDIMTKVTNSLYTQWKKLSETEKALWQKKDSFTKKLAFNSKKGPNLAFEAYLADNLSAERDHLLAEKWLDLAVDDKSVWGNFESYVAATENKMVILKEIRDILYKKWYKLSKTEKATWQKKADEQKLLKDAEAAERLYPEIVESIELTVSEIEELFKPKTGLKLPELIHKAQEMGLNPKKGITRPTLKALFLASAKKPLKRPTRRPKKIFSGAAAAGAAAVFAEDNDPFEPSAEPAEQVELDLLYEGSEDDEENVVVNEAEDDDDEAEGGEYNDEQEAEFVDEVDLQDVGDE